MNNFNTHIIRNFGSDKSELIRAKDGMIIACRQGAGVVFGEDPNVNAGTRHFMDATYAKAFLRRLADIDINAVVEPGKTGNTTSVARIQEIDGERRILAPNGVQ